MRKCTKRWLLPVFAAAMTLSAGFSSLAEETVKVTVPNVKGGYLEVSYEKDGCTFYLPVGETVAVPKGTELAVNAVGVQSITSDEEWIDSVPQSVTINGAALETWFPTADTDLKFDAVFKGKLSDTYDTAEYGLEAASEDEGEYGFQLSPKLYMAHGNGDYSKITGFLDPEDVKDIQLTLYDLTNKKDLGYSKVKNMEIRQIFLDGKVTDNSVFSINSQGVLHADKSLERGEYHMLGSFKIDGKENSWELYVEVGARITVNVPLVSYRDGAGDMTVAPDYTDGRGCDVYADRGKTDRFQDVYKKYQTMEGRVGLAGHTPTGFAEYDADKKQYSSLMSKRVSDEVMKHSAQARAYLMYSDYKPPVVASLSESDLLPESVEPGWNKQNGKWYYYATEDPLSLKTNAWLPCPENDGCGENVWVGSDGAMVTDGIVKTADGIRYLVARNGHRVKNQTMTVGDMVYTTDEEGRITASHFNLATPSNAAEALAQADKVIANADIMSQDEKEQAADMQTEALKTKIDITKLTADQVAKYEALYLAVYGSENIETEPSDAVGGIAAAGLTSEDFREGGGKVTIEYATEWPATSSNARVRGSVKLLVSGKERKTLTAPVTMTVEIPDYFIASYSNASYNYEVEGVDKADVDGEKGMVKITITKLGAFDVKAVKKPSRPSGGGSSSGNSHSSGRARVKADFYKNGKWVMNEKGWWYSYDDGTWPSNSWVYLPWKDTYQWYYFNGEGYMVTGWHHWQNNWYYLYPQADGNRGYMFTGWHEIGGKWYYFSKVNDSSLGAMAYDTTTPDGYKVDKDGAWIQ